MNAQPKRDMEPAIGDTSGLDQQMTGSEPITPFDDGGVDGLFYPGAGRQETLDQLIHLLRYGPSLLVLYGDQGVGKHYLVDRVVAELDLDLFDVAMIQAEVLMNPQQILAGLAAPWHCRSAITMESLQTQLADCASVADDESRVLLLAIRQSQFMDDASVQLISLILASCSGLPVKVLLVMDADDPDELPQFAPLFDQVADHFRLGLAPFNQEETRDYLSYRMQTGGMGQARFSEDQLQRIFNLSLGNAARVNEVAGELLRAALSRKPARGAGGTAVPWMHLGALAVVVIMLLALFFTGSETRIEPPPVAEKIPSKQVVAAVEQASESKIENQIKPELKAQATEPEEAVVGAVEKAPEPQVEPELTLSAKAVEQPAQTDVPAPQPRASQVVVADSKPQEQEKVAAITKQDVEPKQDSRAAWIASLPPEHYAIQLLGAREKVTVDKFLAAYPSVQKLTYYETKRNGAPWYVVVQASYPSYDAAKAAVNKLPKTLQNQGPWIRKIEVIQKDLKN